VDATKPAGAPGWQHEIGRLLSLGRCPACVAGAEAEDLFFRWFRAELHASPPTLEALRRSRGMCPAHGRRQLLDPAAWPAAQSTAPTLAIGALAALDDAFRPGQCPACHAVERHVQTVTEELVTWLNERRNATRYRASAGLCIPHAVDTAQHVGGAGNDGLAIVGQHLIPAEAELLRIAGADPDADRRRLIRAMIDEHPIARTVVSDLEMRLGEDTCPICAEVARNEARCLSWFSHAVRADPDLPRRSVFTLCSRHLHDVSMMDIEAAQIQLAAQAERVTSNAVGVIRASAQRSSRFPSQSGLATPIAAPCMCCQALAHIAQRQTTLLIVALADQRIHSAYLESHGLCLHHRSTQPQLHDMEIITDRLRQRVGLLLWEVEESLLKDARESEFERRGDEDTAWVRLLGQIDGRVTMGVPARLLHESLSDRPRSDATPTGR
jgi:hypothetical protein